MKKIVISVIIISCIILFVLYYFQNRRYVMNLYGDKVDITSELNRGIYELIDSSEIIKFINKEATITSPEKNKVFQLLKSDTLKNSSVVIEYYYSYFLDEEIVDVFIIKIPNKAQSYVVRKSENELILPIEIEQDIWGK